MQEDSRTKDQTLPLLDGMISGSTSLVAHPPPLRWTRPFRTPTAKGRALPRISRHGRRSNFSTARKPLGGLGTDGEGRTAPSMELKPLLRIASSMQTISARVACSLHASGCWPNAEEPRCYDGIAKGLSTAFRQQRNAQYSVHLLGLPDSWPSAIQVGYRFLVIPTSRRRIHEAPRIFDENNASRSGLSCRRGQGRSHD
jgi:hypothetical protein